MLYNKNAFSLDDAALQGVIAMFDGTELTADILMSGASQRDIYGNPVIDENELKKAIMNVINWFLSIKTPDPQEMIGELPEDPVLALYNSLLTNHLPSEVDKQDPQLLLDVINIKKSDTASVDDIPDSVKELYGY